MESWWIGNQIKQWTLKSNQMNLVVILNPAGQKSLQKDFPHCLSLRSTSPLLSSNANSLGFSVFLCGKRGRTVAVKTGTPRFLKTFKPLQNIFSFILLALCSWWQQFTDLCWFFNSTVCWCLSTGFEFTWLRSEEAANAFTLLSERHGVG